MSLDTQIEKAAEEEDYDKAERLTEVQDTTKIKFEKLQQVLELRKDEVVVEDQDQESTEVPAEQPEEIPADKPEDNTVESPIQDTNIDAENTEVQLEPLNEGTSEQNIDMTEDDQEQPIEAEEIEQKDEIKEDDTVEEQTDKSVEEEPIIENEKVDLPDSPLNTDLPISVDQNVEVSHEAPEEIPSVAQNEESHPDDPVIEEPTIEEDPVVEDEEDVKGIQYS